LGSASADYRRERKREGSRTWLNTVPKSSAQKARVVKAKAGPHTGGAGENKAGEDQEELSAIFGARQPVPILIEEDPSQKQSKKEREWNRDGKGGESRTRYLQGGPGS